MRTATDQAAFDAAYGALQHYSTLAQVRATIAELVVDTLANYHPYAAVAVMQENWPAHLTRINSTALADVVLAATGAKSTIDGSNR